MENAIIQSSQASEAQTRIDALSALDIAFKAVRLYAETHPRPLHVSQVQAAEMIGKSHVTVRKMIRAGIIKTNASGMIPVGEIDKVIAAIQ